MTPEKIGGYCLCGSHDLYRLPPPKPPIGAEYCATIKCRTCGNRMYEADAAWDPIMRSYPSDPNTERAVPGET